MSDKKYNKLEEEQLIQPILKEINDTKAEIEKSLKIILKMKNAKKPREIKKYDENMDNLANILFQQGHLCECSVKCKHRHRHIFLYNL